jgi:hypothetical protein
MKYLKKLCLVLIASFVVISNLFAQNNWFKTGQDADLMLSGVDFNNTGGALVFNHPSGIASDGTRFFLCDRFNNRVLVWNSLPTKWDSQPDLVLGQPNFTSNNSGLSKSELNFPGNVSIGSNGVVTAADTDNDRILIWKTFPEQNGQAADIKIDLKNITPVGTQIKYGWPWGVWTDGSRLAAVATSGSSILFWNSLPAIDDKSPDYIITHQHFGTPRNISTDGSTYFFVGDHNSKVGGDQPGTFFWNSYPTQTNQPYDFYRAGEWIKGVKLQDGKLIAGGLSSAYIWNTYPTTPNQQPSITLRNNYYSNGDGVDVVFAGGRLYVNNYNGNNVQVYNSLPISGTQQPDFAIGSPSILQNTLSSINYIQNPVVATDGNILLASSDFDAQLWIWKTIPTISGKAPDIKIPLRTPTLDIAPWDNALSNNRIALAGKRKVVIWNSLPLNGEAPTQTFVDRIGNFQFEELKGVALDDQYFYLSERNGKIGIWKGIPLASNIDPVITFTLPATNLNLIHSDGKYFTAAVMDGNPRGIYIYRVADFKDGIMPQPYKFVESSFQLQLNLPSSGITFNNSFALANNSNNSVLIWKNVEEAGDASKVIVLGQQSLTQTAPGVGINKLHFPGSLAAYGNNLWVGEFKFSSRILKFSYSFSTNVENETLPNQFQLFQNYPNPFNPSTVISWQLSVGSHVTLKVYDLLGREIATLVNEFQHAGEFVKTFHGMSLPTGVYFYTLQAGDYFETKEMLLLK